MNIHRSKRLSIKLTEEELRNWHRAANGEPLAVVVRIVMNAYAREREHHDQEALRSFGEGAESAVLAATAVEPPSPEEQLEQVVEEKREEFESYLGDEAEIVALNEFDMACAYAHLHWTITRGERCSECGGLAK